MTIIETTLATNLSRDETLPWWIRLLRRIIPASNPDVERLYPQIRKWWVEVDDKGVPNREIGFDENGSAIVVGPIGPNFGFWTDSDNTFVIAECPQIQPDTFERVWAECEADWIRLIKLRRRMDRL